MAKPEDQNAALILDTSCAIHRFHRLQPLSEIGEGRAAAGVRCKRHYREATGFILQSSKLTRTLIVIKRGQ